MTTEEEKQHQNQEDRSYSTFEKIVGTLIKTIWLVLVMMMVLNLISHYALFGMDQKAFDPMSIVHLILATVILIAFVSMAGTKKEGRINFLLIKCQTRDTFSLYGKKQ